MILSNSKVEALEIAQFVSKTTVYHGAGSIKLTGDEVAKLGISKVMIITDHGVRNAGLLEPVINSLSASNIAYENNS